MHWFRLISQDAPNGTVKSMFVNFSRDKLRNMAYCETHNFSLVEIWGAP